VRSIIGRFLEHSRIFGFANGGNEEVFAGSADWMPRNLYERCEVVFPVVDEAAKHRLRHEILECYLRDSVKARILEPNDQYARLRPSAGDDPLSAQDWLMQHAFHPETQLDTATAARPAAVPTDGTEKVTAQQK
jgi:polyphosphate kinase